LHGFTGSHIGLVMLGLFGVINVPMATLAGQRWTGIVVVNPDVASEGFKRGGSARAPARGASRHQDLG
jgi:nitrogen fixation protein FixH